MKRTRSYTVSAAALCAALAFTGCGTSPDATAPKTGAREPGAPSVPPAPSSVVGLSALSQQGWAGVAATSEPALKVLDARGIPVPNVTVTFAITQGEGSVSPQSVTTDMSGFARTSWTLGAEGGTNVVAASVAGLSPLAFQADAKVETIIARYDLAQIGDSKLPVSYNTGDAQLTVTGGHYVLAADNSFAFGYEINGIARVVPIGTYVRIDANTIQFYQAPGSYPASDFYRARNGLLSTGRFEGNVMTVTYEDFIDFDVEKYVAAGG